MTRLSRVVVSGLPHHVTQRGNSRQRTFFVDADYTLYRDLLAESLKAAGVGGIERKTGRYLAPGKRGPKPKRRMIKCTGLHPLIETR